MGWIVSPIFYKSSDSVLIFYCPGCKMRHQIRIKPNEDGGAWQWNNDLIKPTFSPSLNVTARVVKTENGSVSHMCHSFIVDGNIQFLGDCWHELKGQTVPIPPWPFNRGSQNSMTTL